MPAPPRRRPGRYDATLCVVNADAAPTCGPAEADLRPGGTLRVRVSDIVYRVHVRPSQAAVVVMHGAMQIDEFLTEARWDGERAALHRRRQAGALRGPVGARRRGAR